MPGGQYISVSLRANVLQEIIQEGLGISKPNLVYWLALRSTWKPNVFWKPLGWMSMSLWLKFKKAIRVWAITQNELDYISWAFVFINAQFLCFFIQIFFISCWGMIFFQVWQTIICAREMIHDSFQESSEVSWAQFHHSAYRKHRIDAYGSMEFCACNKCISRVSDEFWDLGILRLQG